MFVMQARLQVTQDFKDRSRLHYVSSSNVKVKRKEKVGGDGEGKSKQTRVQTNQPHPGRSRFMFPDSAQGTCVITCFVDI